MIGDEEIRQFTADIWATVLGLEAEPTGRPFESATDTLAGRVRITGGWHGTVTLACPVPLAARFAAAMFALPPGAIDTDHQHDAIRELVNIIGGNVKGILPGPSHLSLPDITVDPATADGERVAEVVFECDGQPFQIVVDRESSVAV